MAIVHDMSQDLKEKLKIAAVYESFEGGQKYVFIATRNGIKVAVKVLRGVSPERDVREIEFYKKYQNHAGIPKIIEVVPHDDELVIIEEYIDGENLAKCCGHYKSQDRKIGKLIVDICAIMTPFWEAGIVHRDLKPDNIIVSKDGVPTVIDFGIHKDPENTTITSTDLQPHTVRFCAPEQLIPNKASISYRTDFFCLALMAYFLKYGVCPFGDTRDEIAAVYRAGALKFKSDKNCALKQFLTNTFHVDVAQRPRNASRFLSGVPT